MDTAAYPPMPADLSLLVRSNSGEPLRFVDKETHKIYVVVEQPESVDFDDSTWRNLIQPALDEESRGDVGPLDFEDIKRRGREILARRQSQGNA
jgi:hypothetical protein